MKALFAAPLLLLLLAAGSARADDFHIRDVSIETQIQPSGDIQYVESRTYRFDGLFRWADYTLPKRGFTELRSIEVLDGGLNLIHDNSEEPGTFLVQEDDRRIRIKWHFEAEDEERTFTIAYTLVDAVAVGPEWSEFMWTFLSEGWGRMTERFSAEVLLPGPVPPADLHGWVRGAIRKVALQKEPGTIYAWGDSIGRNEHVIVRTIFPTDVLEGVAVTDERITPEWAAEDEQAFHARQQELAALRAQRDVQGLIGGLVLGILSFIAFGFFYSRYGRREPVPSNVPKELYQPPTDDPPAIAAWLVNHQITAGPQVIATTLDLARRGYLRVLEDQPEKKWGRPEKPVFRLERALDTPAENLEDFEADLLSYIYSRLDDGVDRFDELFSSNKSIATKWFSSWKKMVAAAAKSRGWLDEESRRAVKPYVAIQAVLLVTTFVLALLLDAAPALIGFLLVLIGMALVLVFLRLTPEGKLLYQQWRAYRRALKNVSSMGLERRDTARHFVYAISFGMSEKEIERIVQTRSDDPVFFPWLVMMHTGSSPASMAKSLSTLAATGTTSVASVAGGMGAVGGAAGGGAAGGAGR